MGRVVCENADRGETDEVSRLLAQAALDDCVFFLWLRHFLSVWVIFDPY
jgi:hypothetical protein